MLSVLTYNIHKGFSSLNRDFVLHRIRDQIRELDVDIVLLQEVQGEHRQHARRISNWPDMSQFEFLADEVWPHFAYGRNAIADGRHHGNAILSKYPIVSWGNTNISPFSKASRSLLYGTIVLPDQRKVHLLCLHLGLLGFERRWQIKRLNQHLHSVMPEHDACIIGGDFNDWTSRQVSRWLDPALGLEEVFMQSSNRFAATFPAKWPFLCMDRIYFKGLTLGTCESLGNAGWGELSDHIPLLARFSG